MPRRGYDLLGNLAIIDVKLESAKEKEFARKVLTKHKSVKTVLAKAGAVTGEYRTRNFRYVLGVKNFVATYRENNCIFKFDVRKTFFSNRLSFERARIADLVKDNENVMVFFSGTGPFAIEIAKAHKKATVVGIELNKYASDVAQDNARMNKTTNVVLENGDVKKIAGKYKNFADRIIMPLPQSSTEFLDQALLVAKKGATVHFYAFGTSESAFDDTINKIKAHAKQNGYRIRVLFKRAVRPYSPKEIEIVIDYKIIK